MSKKAFARALDNNSIANLRNRGKLSFLRNRSLVGGDIDIQFRGNYLNLYYKGASLIKFKWLSKNSYEITVSRKYLEPAAVKWLGPKSVFDDRTIGPIRKNFKAIIARLKKNIRYLGKGQENVFEQVFIENNFNSGNNPSFTVIDRQVVIPGSKDRLDIVAISRIKGSRQYRLNLIELKYGPDRRIRNIHSGQLKKYYDMFRSCYGDIIKSYEEIIRQKKSIGLLAHIREEVSISGDPKTMRKFAVLGNIDKDHDLIKEAKREFDENTFCIIQNNILEDPEK